MYIYIYVCIYIYIYTYVYNYVSPASPSRNLRESRPKASSSTTVSWRSWPLNFGYTPLVSGSEGNSRLRRATGFGSGRTEYKVIMYMYMYIHYLYTHVVLYTSTYVAFQVSSSWPSEPPRIRRLPSENDIAVTWRKGFLKGPMSLLGK